MSRISELSDCTRMSDNRLSYHDVWIKAHHVEMENVLGTNWSPSGDSKSMTGWSFMFHEDNGESFPATVYDWKEYDDYYRCTTHNYHIGTRTTQQAKLVAAYLKARLLDFMKITMSKFYFPGLTERIKVDIQRYCSTHSIPEIQRAHIQIYADGSIEIGDKLILRAKNVFEPLVFLIKSDERSLERFEWDMDKIERLANSVPPYLYYRYLNSIQVNRNPDL